MPVSNTPLAEPFSKEFSKDFGAGAVVVPTMSPGQAHALRLILGRAVALIIKPRPSHTELTEAARLINAVYATLGGYAS